MPKKRPADPKSCKGADVSRGESIKKCPKIPEGCEYLNKSDLVTAPEKSFDPNRGKPKVGKPAEQPYKFRGAAKESDSIVRDVEVNGTTIKVIAPKNASLPKGKSVPTIQQVADSLAVLPKKQLESIPEVVINPNPNPDDAYWEKEYGIKDFTSAATGGKGGVTIYPTGSWGTSGELDRVIVHESGHTFAHALWEKDKDAKKEWEKAVKEDGHAPSKYAESSVDEDFSESLVMYNLSKGTKCEPAAKALYPERYKVLDNLMK